MLEGGQAGLAPWYDRAGCSDGCVEHTCVQGRSLWVVGGGDGLCLGASLGGNSEHVSCLSHLWAHMPGSSGTPCGKSVEYLPVWPIQWLQSLESLQTLWRSGCEAGARPEPLLRPFPVPVELWHYPERHPATHALHGAQRQDEGDRGEQGAVAASQGLLCRAVGSDFCVEAGQAMQASSF